MTRGLITGISGSTVRVEMSGLKLYDRVYVGKSMLTGEVVRLEHDGAVVQVYEDTRGLGRGEPVTTTGRPLIVRLGPGLLSGIFDGLQRPLELLREQTGDFISPGKELYAIDYMRQWEFVPIKNEGDELNPYDFIGHVKEAGITHYISCGAAKGRISYIASGGISLNSVFAVLDDDTEIFGCHEWPVRSPRPYVRKFSSNKPLITGQRAIDFLMPLALGGTAVMPGGFGTGKTILEQTIAKFADADVIVYAGCGERGNEMAELIEALSTTEDKTLGKRLFDRTSLIVNTSNMPVAAREASIYTAITMAEYYRDMGYNVLMLADSLSRWAEALREISTTLEEMPGDESYPTYLSSRLSGFIERAGAVKTLSGGEGSLTLMLSTSPPGGDFTEPVTQSCMRVCGACMFLDSSLAHKRHFPAINWQQSYSLYDRALDTYFNEGVSADWAYIKSSVISVLKKDDELREITEVVGTEGLQDQDRLVIKTASALRDRLLYQNAFTSDAFSAPEATLDRARRVISAYDEVSSAMKLGKTLQDALKGHADALKGGV